MYWTQISVRLYHWKCKSYKERPKWPHIFLDILHDLGGLEVRPESAIIYWFSTLHKTVKLYHCICKSCKTQLQLLQTASISLRKPQVALISSSCLKFMIWEVEILLTASSNLFNSTQIAVICSKRVLEPLQSLEAIGGHLYDLSGLEVRPESAIIYWNSALHKNSVNLYHGIFKSYKM